MPLRRPARKDIAKRARDTDWNLLIRRARELVLKGWDRVRDNLSAAEQRELLDLLRRSRGRPGNLSSRERRRLRELVQKAATGRKPR